MSKHPGPPTYLEKLQIPPIARHLILPAPNLDVLNLLNFSLPPIPPSASTGYPLANFSEAAVTCEDASTIRRFMVPQRELVNTLFRGKSDAVRNGSQSLCYVSSQFLPPAHLPLWVLTFWDEVLSLRGTEGAYTQWRNAEDWLRARRKIWRVKTPLAMKTAVEQTYEDLASLPWSGDVQGFDNPEPLHTLATYATHEWFSDVHENQMLDLLRLQVGRRNKGCQFEVENLAFWKFLKTAYDQREGGAYFEDRYLQRPRELGEALQNGVRDVVVMIVNLLNVHWVGVAVNFRQSCILYGDSLDRPPDKPTVDILRWWTEVHTGSPFSVQSLSITRQPDGHSCGLMSWNAIAHYLLPDCYPLLNHLDLDAARLHILHEVIRRHQDEVRSQSHILTMPGTHLIGHRFPPYQRLGMSRWIPYNLAKHRMQCQLKCSPGPHDRPHGRPHGRPRYRPHDRPHDHPRNRPRGHPPLRLHSSCVCYSHCLAASSLTRRDHRRMHPLSAPTSPPSRRSSRSTFFPRCLSTGHTTLSTVCASQKPDKSRKPWTRRPCHLRQLQHRHLTGITSPLPHHPTMIPCLPSWNNDVSHHHPKHHLHPYLLHHKLFLHLSHCLPRRSLSNQLHVSLLRSQNILGKFTAS